jgi:hypothetical protein
MIGYYDSENLRVALLHQYLLPNGKIGASGQADPKEVLHEGIFYYVPAE